MIEKEKLYNFYNEDKLSTRKIAKLLGISDSTVIHWMKKYGIKRRNKSECLSGKLNPMFRKNHTPENIEIIKHAGRKYTENEFKHIVLENGFDLIGNYNGENKPILLKCLTCGKEKKLKQAKNAHVRKPFCKICDKENWSKGRKLKSQRFFLWLSS